MANPNWADSTGRRNTSITEVCDGTRWEADIESARGCATAEYIDWFNHRRLHGEIGYRPPIEVENEFLNRTTPAITPIERV